jgi:hypothetical protein
MLADVGTPEHEAILLGGSHGLGRAPAAEVLARIQIAVIGVVLLAAT